MSLMKEAPAKHADVYMIQYHTNRLHICLRVVGENHPETLNCVNSLARICQEVDNITAELFYLWSLRLYGCMLGNKHPDTLTCVNDLAQVLGDQGRYGEAEAIYYRSFDLHLKSVGEEHPSTLHCIRGLARMFWAQDQELKAEKYLKWLVPLHRAVFGHAHPNTLAVLDDMATFLVSYGRYAAAESVNRGKLKICLNELGADHGSTIKTMGRLARTLELQKKWDIAKGLREEILGRQVRTLKAIHHRSTLQSMEDLARVFEAVDDLPQAESLLREKLRICRHMFGEDHLWTFESKEHVADILSVRGKDAEARMYY